MTMNLITYCIVCRYSNTLVKYFRAYQTRCLFVVTQDSINTKNILQKLCDFLKNHTENRKINKNHINHHYFYISKVSPINAKIDQITFTDLAL